jgi:hypothetical protein
MFDISGRAKWDAWNSTAHTYGDRCVEVENRYLDIARNLGWVEGTASKPQQSLASEHGVKEGIWDKDDGTASGGIGWGTAVSTLAAPTSDENGSVTIHGLALSNDAPGLASFLRKHPHVNINETDEFVCLFYPGLRMDDFDALPTGIYSTPLGFRQRQSRRCGVIVADRRGSWR